VRLLILKAARNAHVAVTHCLYLVKRKLVLRRMHTRQLLLRPQCGTPMQTYLEQSALVANCIETPKDVIQHTNHLLRRAVL